MSDEPLTANVELCRSAVEALVSSLVEDVTPQQAYRNVAHAFALLRQHVADRAASAREQRALILAESKKAPSAPLE